MTHQTSLKHLQIILITLCLLLPATGALAQAPDRVSFNGQELWLSGTNVAWVNFARDLGPGTASLSEFELAFQAMRENGGNTMRLWLHTTGAHTPVWNGDMVTGPGANTIQNLTSILDLAEQYDIALMLCLWSFDMMRITNGETVTNRSRAILTQQANRQSYIDNALIPMVEAVKGHKAILAWEIFNEAEGMSEEFGWSLTHHVPMISIQQFVNQTAGAIKRTDPDVLVTNGTHTFTQISDIYTPVNALHMNYYRDDRLIGLGGDSLGTLDFYTVHYYGSGDSPFSRHLDYFEVDKPLALGEFFIQGNVEGIDKERIFKRLYDNGYAGALSWQWIDWRQNRNDNQSTWLNTIPNMQYMYSRYRDDVELTYGVKPVSFTFAASETVIEAGFPTTLSWLSRDAETVTLNGDPVLVMDQITVNPLETTDYVLALTHSDGTTVTDTITITVIPNLEVDRATDAPVFTDADGRWTYYDLGASYGIVKAVLPFNSKPAAGYAIQGSYDGMDWTTWQQVAGGSGTQTDTLFLEPGFDGTFIRIISDDAFELNAISAYGLLSEMQPPKLTVTFPADGDVLEPGRITFTTEVINGSGTFSGVYFHINGEQKFWRRFRPYTYNYDLTEPGDYTVSIEVRETNFPSFFSRPVHFTVVDRIQRTRYEAEDAQLSGTLQVQSNPDASGGKYVEMNNSGDITWPNIYVEEADSYTIRIGYYLPFDHKTQYLDVNGVRADTVLFPTPVNTWQYVERKIDLNAGNNTVAIINYWGYMWFDYLEVLDGNHVSIEEPADLPVAHSLGLNYPNPFNPQTVIPYELAHQDYVVMDVYDIMGRKIARIDEGVRTAGRHQAVFDGTGLASGVYLYRLQAGNTVMTGRMMLLK